MSDYTKEFNDWWYKPLLESAKSNGGAPDKDMMRYKDLGKQSAFHAWIARGQEITRLKKALRKYEGCIDEVKFMNKDNERLVVFINDVKDKITKIMESKE